MFGNSETLDIPDDWDAVHTRKLAARVHQTRVLILCDCVTKHKIQDFHVRAVGDDAGRTGARQSRMSLYMY